VLKNKVALVIGNGEYAEEARLDKPTADASAVAASLKQIGFDSVDLVLDGSRRQLEDALDNFSDIAAGSDVALIYYAGHGIQVSAENYILPVDVIPESQRDLKKLVSMQELLDEAGKAKDLGVIILDACRNNPFINNFNETVGRGISRKGLALPQGASSNTLIAYATESNALAIDALPGEANSPYTTALLEHISTAQLDIRLMFGRVRDTVLKSTAGKQKPFVYGSIGGDQHYLNSTGIGDTDSAESPVTVASLPAKTSTESLFSTLTVKVSPADAVVRIMNIDDKYVPGMRLRRAGSYDLFVSKRGYSGIRKTISLSEANEVVEFELVERGKKKSPSSEPINVATRGIASFNESSTPDGVEQVRIRAINNAMEVAVLRVAGALVSGEKANIGKLSDTVSVSGTAMEEKLKQDAVFNNTVVASSDGYARLIDVSEEGEVDGVYRVDAIVEVVVEKLEQQMKNAGFFWERVGQPEVTLALQKSNNGRTVSDVDTLGFLRDTLSKNGIKVSTSETSAAYSVNANLQVATSHVKEFGTYAGSCSMSYEIIDSGNQNSVGAFRKATDAVPGFSHGESAKACERKVVSPVAQAMVERLLVEFDDVWNKGRLFQLSFAGIGGGDVTDISNTIRSIFRVTNLTGIEFSNSTASMDVQFKGVPFEFVEAVTKTLEFEDISVELDSMVENQIIMRINN